MMAKFKSMIAAGTLLALTTTAVRAERPLAISEYVEGYRWLQQAEWLADAEVTYAACGWGRISLAPDRMEATTGDGLTVRQREAFLRRYDAALRERLRLEVILSASGQPAHARTRGIFATGGCADSVKREIEALRPR